LVCMQTSYTHDQMKRAYKDFVGQFDTLTDADVRWTPYSEELSRGAHHRDSHFCAFETSTTG
jgi:hypothetical protein